MPSQESSTLRRRNLVSAMPLLPPLSSCRPSCYTPKAPLVTELAAFYERLPSTSGRRDPEYTTGRVFTPMMHGLLFSLSEEALLGLVNDPEQAEEVCRAAQAFVSMGMVESSVESILAADDVGFVAMGSSWLPDVPRSAIVSILANTRDRGICVVSGKMLGVEQVPIVPRSILSSSAARNLFHAVTPITQLLLGDEFAAIYLGAVFRAGRLGLCPCRITRDGGAGEGFRVHFSVHWMHKTVVSGEEAEVCREPGLCSINAMLFQCRTEERESICEFDVTGKQIKEGDCFFVDVSTAADAIGMHDMLAFRWTVGVVFCLGGMCDAFPT
ncbi:hypothetical protein LEL_05770 [Akanthomyces lecanii RCEF 1005]|uniref:Uncharacterized protein n=1 Tax=Akanthomyces lecanii RCEF 1005 TaxID=1081108 RepID=A0A168G697_CORDF|nr:hypothetical protein LEL_05770 [Akanthomyces lecanii RCEF 1005]